MGYVKQYEGLIEKSYTMNLSLAEIQILLSFDQGILYQHKQASLLSKTLLREWLPKYKLKDWNKTETSGTPVDDTRKVTTADNIWKALSEPDKWHSHGRGISRDVLQNEVGLRITDFGAMTTRSKKIRVRHSPRDLVASISLLAHNCRIQAIDLNGVVMETPGADLLRRNPQIDVDKLNESIQLTERVG